MIAGPIFVLVFLLAFDRGLVAQALHAPWLRKLGEWSFATYMVHYTVLAVLPLARLQATPWLDCVVGIGGSVVAGGLAWRFIERPGGEIMRRRLLKVFRLT